MSWKSPTRSRYTRARAVSSRLSSCRWRRCRQGCVTATCSTPVLPAPASCASWPGRRDVVNRMMSNVRQNLRYSGLAKLLAEALPPEQENLYSGKSVDAPMLYYNDDLISRARERRL